MCHWNFLFWHVSYLVVNGCDEIFVLQEMNHFFLAIYSSFLMIYFPKDCQRNLLFFPVHLKHVYHFSILGLLFLSMKWCVTAVYQAFYCKPIDWLPLTWRTPCRERRDDKFRMCSLQQKMKQKSRFLLNFLDKKRVVREYIFCNQYKVNYVFVCLVSHNTKPAGCIFG